MADMEDGSVRTEKAARLRAIQEEADRLGSDVSSLGNSLKDLLEAHARAKPLQTVAIALGVGWLLGKRL
jgi:ElaB/YqjD/DUF883 family membrane-anchored ribosome-binding protein